MRKAATPLTEDRILEIFQAAERIEQARSAEPTNDFDGAHLEFEKGDLIHFRWDGGWWNGRILQKKGFRYLVDCLGYQSDFQEWMSPRRIMRLAPPIFDPITQMSRLRTGVYVSYMYTPDLGVSSCMYDGIIEKIQHDRLQVFFMDDGTRSIISKMAVRHILPVAYMFPPSQLLFKRTDYHVNIDDGDKTSEDILRLIPKLNQDIIAETIRRCEGNVDSAFELLSTPAYRHAVMRRHGLDPAAEPIPTTARPLHEQKRPDERLESDHEPGSSAPSAPPRKVELVNCGEIVWAPAWSTRGFVFPKNYEARVEYDSPTKTESCMYRVCIKEGTDGKPIFESTCEDTGLCISDSSSDSVHKSVLNQLLRVNRAKHFAKVRMKGPSFFGLNDQAVVESIRNMIQQALSSPMPGVLFPPTSSALSSSQPKSSSSSSISSNLNSVPNPSPPGSTLSSISTSSSPSFSLYSNSSSSSSANLLSSNNSNDQKGPRKSPPYHHENQEPAPSRTEDSVQKKRSLRRNVSVTTPSRPVSKTVSHTTNKRKRGGHEQDAQATQINSDSDEFSRMTISSASAPILIDDPESTNPIATDKKSDGKSDEKLDEKLDKKADADVHNLPDDSIHNEPTKATDQNEDSDGDSCEIIVDSDSESSPMLAQTVTAEEADSGAKGDAVTASGADSAGVEEEPGSDMEVIVVKKRVPPAPVSRKRPKTEIEIIELD
eukprot:GILJ01015727.1.p1 GENE.GILJ01015727.1~~GILJ01015727.1.p1  ORF type:complete len:714 (-),score=120.24 GILJ01015727.1:338-2479(-)